MSTFGVDPDQDEVEAMPLADVAHELENLLVSHATGSKESQSRFRALRDRLRQELPAEQIPSFVRQCRSLDQFWAFIKQAGGYVERRRLIWEAFAPLHEQLEAGASPAAEATAEALTALDAEHVNLAWKKALERRANDPAGAITAARTLLESVCKMILDECGVEHDDEDLPRLYRKVTHELTLGPTQQTEADFRQAMQGCYSAVQALAALRNRLSDSHGQGGAAVQPEARHADLAVNLAGAMATFLVETWVAREEGEG